MKEIVDTEPAAKLKEMTSSTAKAHEGHAAALPTLNVKDLSSNCNQREHEG